MARVTSDSNLPVHYERQGFSFRHIVTVLFRRKMIILAVSLPLIAIGGFNLLGKAGTYTASARVVVELVRVDLPKWNPNSRTVDYDREMNNLVQTALSMPVAREAAAALQDSIPVIEKLDERLKGLNNRETFAEYLLEGLGVNVVGESSIMDFRFTATSPRVALMAVDALRTAFLEFKVHGQKNTGAVDYYEEQIGVVRASVDTLLAKRAAVLEAAGYSTLTDEIRYDAGRLANLESDLLTDQAALEQLQVQYNHLRAALDGDPREFPMGPDENRSSTLIYWMNTVAKHDDELNGILAVYTKDSDPARRKQAQIDESLRNLALEERKFVTGVGVALASLRQKVATMQEQVRVAEQQNSRAPGIYRQVTLIDSELSAYNELLQSLQEKMGEVRMAEYADERVSNAMDLSDPTIVSVLAGGTTIVYFVALLFLSLALGIVSGFVAENLDHRVYSPRDVEDNLRLQVFASVSKVD